MSSNMPLKYDDLTEDQKKLVNEVCNPMNHNAMPVTSEQKVKALWERTESLQSDLATERKRANELQEGKDLRNKHFTLTLIELSQQKQRADKAEAALEVLKERLQTFNKTDVGMLIVTFSTFIDRLEEIHADQSYQAVWILWMNHFGQYQGPNYTKELQDCKDVLSSLNQAKEEK